MDPAVIREIARHRYLTLARVNGKIDTELEAFRTLQDGQELQEVRVQKRYLGVIDKWIDYAETALEEANRKDGRQVHWAEYSSVITDTYEPEAEVPESYERSAPPYTPRSKSLSIIEELGEEEDILASFPVPPSTKVASVSDLADYSSRLPASHDTSDRSGTDKSESRRNRFKRSQG